MKKYLVFIFCLFTIMTVKADNPSMILECTKDTIEIEEKVFCDLKLSFSDITVTNINFDYDSQLDLSFIEKNNTITKNNNSVSINY